MNRVGFHRSHDTQPSRMMYLDSTDATHLTQLTSHYTYAFKDAIETRAAEGMLVSLSSASIPYSFYNIRTGVNNVIHYNDTQVSLTAGNYNATSLADTIMTAFSNNLEVSYSRTQQKYVFKNLDSSPIELKFEGFDDCLMAEIGFSLSSDQDSRTFPYNTVKVAPNVADLNGSVHAIYVRTNLATRSVMESYTGGVSDILAKIDINSDPGGIITLDPQQVSHEALIHTDAVTHIEIRLTDERNRLLDLNGLHSQVGLRFRFVNIWVSAPEPVPDDRRRLAPKEVEAQAKKKGNKKQKVKETAQKILR